MREQEPRRDRKTIDEVIAPLDESIIPYFYSSGFMQLEQDTSDYFRKIF
jgi:hypothetical protein